MTKSPINTIRLAATFQGFRNGEDIRDLQRDFNLLENVIEVRYKGKGGEVHVTVSSRKYNRNAHGGEIYADIHPMKDLTGASIRQAPGAKERVTTTYIEGTDSYLIGLPDRNLRFIFNTKKRRDGLTSGLQKALDSMTPTEVAESWVNEICNGKGSNTYPLYTSLLEDTKRREEIMRKFGELNSERSKPRPSQ